MANGWKFIDDDVEDTKKKAPEAPQSQGWKFVDDEPEAPVQQPPVQQNTPQVDVPAAEPQKFGDAQETYYTGEFAVDSAIKKAMSPDAYKQIFSQDQSDYLASLQNDVNVPYEQYVREAARVLGEQGKPFLGIDRKAFDEYRAALAAGQVAPQGVEVDNAMDYLQLPNLKHNLSGDPDTFLGQVGRTMQAEGQQWGMGAIARTAADWSDYGGEFIDRTYPNLTPEQRESLQEEFVAVVQRRLRELQAKEISGDDLFPQLIGGVLTPDPADILPLGKAAKSASSGS